MITRERKRSFWLYATCGVSIWAACWVSPARGINLLSFLTPQGRCRIVTLVKHEIEACYDFINTTIELVSLVLGGAIEHKVQVLNASMDNKIRRLDASMDNKVRLLLEEHIGSYHKSSSSNEETPYEEATHQKTRSHKNETSRVATDEN